MINVRSAWSDTDMHDFSRRGMSPSDIEEQITRLRNGSPAVVIDRVCTVGDGILSLEDASSYLSKSNQVLDPGRVLRFVPASGAASRMFDLLSKVASGGQEWAQSGEWETFRKGIDRFAFFAAWKKAVDSAGYRLEDLWKQKDYLPALKILLGESGLAFATLPKALVPFHRYSDGTVRSALEEHVHEADVISGSTGKSAIHFTIASDHEELFKRAVVSLEKQFPQMSISFSIQSPSTDTVCLDEVDAVVRDRDGRLIFRPGGHGALLRNLEDCQADIVVIRNIDNVMHAGRLPPLIQYRQMLIGLLVTVQDSIFQMLRQVDRGPVRREAVEKVLSMGNVEVPSDFDSQSHDVQRSWLLRAVNRPIRVCAVVPNSGHPGGGPFWVSESDGSVSKQIVEMNQIQPGDRDDLLSATTHFNPVDMVLGVRNYCGEPFVLRDFSNPDHYLVSTKKHKGKTVRVLEWPGLWNAGMAKWFTVFVEVPPETFTPVKTVNDLLQSSHQEM